MEEQRIFAYSELIQELLKCPQGEEGALLVKNAALVDMGLIITMQVTAKKMKETGYENDAVWLHYLADQVTQIDARQFITEAIQKIVQAREAGLEEEVDISIESWRQERTLADVVSTDIYSWMRNHEARINQYSFNAIPVVFEDLKNQYSLLIIASLFNDLGICLCYAFKELETRKIGVDAAIIAYECALSIHTKEVPELWAEGISNLANAYLERIQGNKEDNIQKAIEYLEQIPIVCTRDTLPVLWAGIQNNLAGAYYRLQPFVGLEVLKQVIHYYELSLEIYEQEDCLPECLSTSRTLGDVNVEYDQWEEAIKAYQKALDAAEKIYQESFLIEGEAAAFKFFSDLPRRAAYAYAKTGQNSLAVITIENARARKLSKVWQLDRAVVQDASVSSSDYQNIKQKIQELEHQQRSD